LVLTNDPICWTRRRPIRAGAGNSNSEWGSPEFRMSKSREGKSTSLEGEAVILNVFGGVLGEAFSKRVMGDCRICRVDSGA